MKYIIIFRRIYMKKILKILSAGFLILTFPVTALGASYESEE